LFIHVYELVWIFNINVFCYTNKKRTKNHTVAIGSKIYWKNHRNRGNIDKHTYIHERSLCWIGTGTSLKSGRVKLQNVVYGFHELYLI